MQLELDLSPPPRTRLKDNGYLLYSDGPHAGKYVHRVVAEQKIGRPLRADEEAHHLDGNKLNNAPHNITVLPRGEHRKLHAIDRQRDHAGRWAPTTTHP